MITVNGLKKYFPVKRGLLQKTVGWVRAVDGVSFTLQKGKTMGLVGESGCGKTTIGRLVIGLLEPDKGDVTIDGQSISTKDRAQRQHLRFKIQIIFQDPYGSLNPRMKVGEIVTEGMKISNKFSNQQINNRLQEILDMVGLPHDARYRYPHEFSGGERQRIGIARALILQPDFIVCDEPVSSLDVSIQAQILNLLQSLKNKLSLTYLFISHDLNVIEHISDLIAVMYLGKIVEIADSRALYESPQHPYTKALLWSIPIPDPTKRSRKIKLKGEVPSPITPPTGCRFHPRCDCAQKICCHEEPKLTEKRTNHFSACHIA